MQPESDKNLSTKAQPFTETEVKSSKIKWHHARWFWGVVIGVVFVITIFLYSRAPQNDFNSIIDLLVYIFWSAPLGLPVIILAMTNFNASLWLASLLVYRVFYLVLFIFLLYKTFCNPRVKIIYPIVWIVYFIVSAIFAIIASSFV